ncbi:cytochrome P450 9e2-like [Malaya genurostris]|uniref:cytochrome P450 9e2-like n=1 Tax=Malaya genurostris TaxID=325434 RepID=UPI0026F3AF2D|nr:cytochrome P450 9e2-like [Malaya genurostris]XP_058462585.1 cytochrome P450 9e2-like [Malaya genurostris]
MEVNLLLLTGVIAVLAYLYHLITKNNDYFHDKPIPSLVAKPLLGSSGPLLLKRVTFPDFIMSIYNKFPSVKVLGLFDTTTPMFVVRDPELIKRIGVKDFDHFVDHRPIFGNSEEIDSPHALFGKSLFSMNGQRWRDMRATLSPAFTGSKMRQMFHLMTNCIETMVEFYETELGKTSGTKEVEVKDILSRLGMDVIASCAFGLKLDSFKNQDSEFIRQAKKMLAFGKISTVIKVFAFRWFPKVVGRLGLDLIDREQAIYFSEIIKDTVKTRESQGIVRHDMIDLLLQAKKGTLKHHQETEMSEGFATVQESDVGKIEVSTPMTETEMIAQCLIFFVGGFDTVSTSATFLIYELIRNPDIQKTLKDEIDQTNKSLGGGPLTYEVLQKMKYLDMVVSESLRIWPPAPAIDRLCVRDYTLDDGEGLRFTIDKGTCVWVPAQGLHHDPQYYPNPERFDPERFNDENKGNINMGAYLPFGIGPRNCIGSRFALMEIKAIVYYLMLKFSFKRSPNTQIPLKLKKGFTNLQAENGMHMTLQLRDDK